MEDEEWNWDEAKKNGQIEADLQLKFLVSSTDEDWQNELMGDAPVRCTRLLTDIYARCNITVCEPTDFEAAVKENNWMAAMKEELSMIEKKKHGS